MPRPRVDYDRISSGYDQRFACSGTPGVAAALQALVAELAPERILEVGCGTGHWLAGLQLIRQQLAGPGLSPSRSTGSRQTGSGPSSLGPPGLGPSGPGLFGLDLSGGMLRQACQRSGPLHLVQGRASSLPFSDACFDLVYCANALHHFDEPLAFVREAWRLLRPGGRLAVVGTDPRAERDHWYLYDYFPGTREADLARFPSWDTLLDWMAGSGFGRLARQPVEEIHDTKVGRVVLDDPFLQKDAVSQLSLLSDEAYRAGLRRIEVALVAAETAGECLTFATDLTLVMVSGCRV
jgi:ubiquinone/menaquinone biosynthesis C-methylase UbiE